MTVAGPDQGYHDIRHGATAYSAVVGTLGALAVPAIIVVFTTAIPQVANARTLATFATALLVAGMFGSLLGAIALAYLGAERDPIAGLAPAIAYAAVPVVVSFCCILGAFEVLAALYQPSAKTLFSVIVAAGGLFGVVYTSFAVVHSLNLGPRGDERRAWLEAQQIREHASAVKAARLLGSATAIPVLSAVILRLAGVHLRPTSSIVAVDVILALALIAMGPLLAVLRTAPSQTPAEQQGLRLHELYAANFAMSGFAVLLLLTLP